MSASEPDRTPVDRVCPGDFARILLAASGSPPRARARDQQADLAGEALRQRVLNRLIVLDPDPDELEEALLAVIMEFGEPAGPTRGVCTAIHQEWEMARIQPDYWSFLVAQALQPEKRTPGSRFHRAAEPDAEV
ncbi:MAG: hypothetical protein ACLQU5_36555 [Isosphaeraceae bacterium]